MSNDVLMFGAWDGPGHRLRATSGEAPGIGEGRDVYGWYYNLERILDSLGTVPREQQVQGHARFYKVEDYSILQWWDRSGDPRYGSHTVFLVRGDVVAS